MGDAKGQTITPMVERMVAFLSQAGGVAGGLTDPDGAPIDSPTGLASFLTGGGIATRDDANWGELHGEVWRQYEESPFVGTSVRDTVGFLTGQGFGISSGEGDVDDLIYETNEHFANKLYRRFKAYALQRCVSGELHLILTVNPRARGGKGLVEVDWADPKEITGIRFHPRKTRMPLLYRLGSGEGAELVPTIDVIHDPSLLAAARSDKCPVYGTCPVDPEQLAGLKRRDPKLKPLGGYRRFIVEWEGSSLTKRELSTLRSVIVWSNFYTLLKLIEIDHKRAMSAFVWNLDFTDAASFESYLAIPPEKRAEMGLEKPKKTASTVITPPGASLKAVCPQLPSLSGQDTDIKEAMVGGLNQPSDAVTGTSDGTYASVKASRGPWGARMQDVQEEFRRFLVHDLYGNIVTIHRAIFGLNPSHSGPRVVGFDEKQQPIVKIRPLRIDELILVDLPLFDAGDFEKMVKAWLGTKHPGAANALGISNAFVARRIGIHNYTRERMLFETERKTMPALEKSIDQEARQETSLADGEEKNDG